MRKIRLLITEKGLEVLRAFAEENYLGNYIANNENDAYYKNILNFPDVLEKIKDDIVLYAKDDISSDDEFVWVESMADMKRKNATCFMLIKIISVKIVKKCWHCFIVDILWKNG